MTKKEKLILEWLIAEEQLTTELFDYDPSPRIAGMQYAYRRVLQEITRIIKPYEDDTSEHSGLGED